MASRDDTSTGSAPYGAFGTRRPARRRAAYGCAGRTLLLTLIFIFLAIIAAALLWWATASLEDGSGPVVWPPIVAGTATPDSLVKPPPAVICPPEPGLTVQPDLPSGPAANVVQGVFPPAAVVRWSVDELPELAGMSQTVTTVLEHNAVQYPGRLGPYYAFRPGDLYPEIYLRDQLTASKLGQYLYGRAMLRSGIEEFLANQLDAAPADADEGKHPYPGPGAVPGYLTLDSRQVKTTATSDEESSAVQLAYLYYQTAGGADWLRCAVDGQSVLERLNRAMERLVLGRQDAGSGLIRRAHTTDWGDVRFQGGERPTMSDPNGEVWTASIYDQAWTYLALRQLAELNRAVGQAESAERWDSAAARLRANAQQFLWQPSRGFFRIHTHLYPWTHSFDEDDIVAIGNAAAIYTGLAEPAQVGQILNALERARLQAGATKPGVSVYPPYPAGFFRHELLEEPGTHQNGGLWDWWGGVEITGAFETGYSEQAWANLAEVAREWATHPEEIAEWQDAASNEPEGSSNYAAAAGAMGEAVVRGLFGISIREDGFRLEPRLGDRSGQISVVQPASGYGIALEQQVTEDRLEMAIAYTSTHKRPGVLSVRLPADRVAEAVLVDGAPQPFTMVWRGNDAYVDAGVAPTGEHRVIIQLREDAGPAYAAVWERYTIPPVMQAGRAVPVQLVLLNTGTAVWGNEGNDPVRVAYRWLDESGAPLLAGEQALEGRIELPTAVESDGEIAINKTLTTPRQAGRYRLQLGLAQGNAPWFHEASPENTTLDLPILVTDQIWRAQVLNVEPDFRIPASQQTTFGVSVQNAGTSTWAAAGPDAVRIVLNWHWPDGTPYRELGLVAPVPLLNDAAPGDVVRVNPLLPTPRVPGVFRASFELISGTGEPFPALDSSNAAAEITVTVE